jgi:uncharacterized RDD family membrane protein YckC
MNLASRTERLVAQVIDGLIAFGLLLALAFFGALAPEAIAWVFSLSGLLLFVGYILFGDSLPGGQSYGKRMAGIAVINEHTGAPCSPWQSFLRNVMLSVLGLFDWVFIFGEKHQRLGDMAAGTIVVDAVAVGAGRLRPRQETPRMYTAG